MLVRLRYFGTGGSYKGYTVSKYLLLRGGVIETKQATLFKSSISRSSKQTTSDIFRAPKVDKPYGPDYEIVHILHIIAFHVSLKWPQLAGFIIVHTTVFL